MNHNQPLAIDSNRRLTTEELAAVLAMCSQTLRKRLSQTGSYYGVRPIKLPNGKLRWPADSFDQLLIGRHHDAA
ncbi:DNA-binding protein [Collimonas silvisoli]|uniref:DNA-binding protein n=1 Tax=Collimonas silvisoli TaxID=2825884 RepID=UPI001B8AAA64|nr:DNA-binding protein [Collimonas silvisoli]